MQRDGASGRPVPDCRLATPTAWRRSGRRGSISAVPGVVGVAVALTISGISMAWWTSEGRGKAFAASQTLRPLVIEAHSEATSGGAWLHPGGPAAELTLSIHNPNAVPVRIREINQDGPVQLDDHSDACPSDVIEVQAQQLDSMVISANASRTLRLPDAVRMKESAPSTCMGAIFTIPVTSVAIT